MSGAGRACQKANPIENNFFNTVSHRKAALLPDISPDLYKIKSGFGRKDVPRLHSGLDFKRAR
jgi:hypothetical protein